MKLDFTPRKASTSALLRGEMNLRLFSGSGMAQWRDRGGNALCGAQLQKSEVASHERTEGDFQHVKARWSV